MVKWVASLVMLFALTGQVLAGVCGCLHQRKDTHSCCKPDKSRKTSISARGCCSPECGVMSTSKTPANKSSNVSTAQVDLKQMNVASSTMSWLTRVTVVREKATSLYFRHRHTLARPPDALYLRHHSFLI